MKRDGGGFSAGAERGEAQANPQGPVEDDDRESGREVVGDGSGGDDNPFVRRSSARYAYRHRGIDHYY